MTILHKPVLKHKKSRIWVNILPDDLLTKAVNEEKAAMQKQRRLPTFCFFD